VTLKVYDMTGKDVATLMNGVYSPAVYPVHWDASGLSSGTYFYRLTVVSHENGKGLFVSTRKMVLLK
jgi:hypothetical protein